MEKRIKELENLREKVINNKNETIEIINSIDNELKRLREKLEQEHELDMFIRNIANGRE